MKSYYRIMLGRKSIYAEEAYKGNFIGVDFLPNIDLTGKLLDNWREFNQKFIPIYLENRPEKTSKIAAWLACGSLWVLSKGINKWDIVLCPNGAWAYYIWEVTGDYSYVPWQNLAHRRIVNRYPKPIERTDMSQLLQNSTWSIGTVSNITKYAEEIEKLIEGNRPARIISTDETIEDPTTFALEKHLEDFLVTNWKYTELGKGYDIFEEEGELVGQQYPTDTGPIDILAISKDKKELLVVELKKWRVSDVVVGQVQRYMGYVKDELTEKWQIVKWVIVWLDDDVRVRRALSVTNNIDFYKYQVSFKLIKG